MDTLDHLLVVDDDRDIRELLTDYLTRNGFRATAVADGRAMREALAAHAFDLVILDVMLPGEDGLTLCRELRARSNLPILMLTARGDDLDRIVGLEMGADDYLPKPFNPRELLARIQAVLRRRPPAIPGAPTSGERTTVSFGDVCVDLATRSLKRGEETIALTTGEFSVLKALLEHPRQPQSRERLMTLARGREQGPYDRAIDVQISRLRKLVEPDPGTPRYLQTVWGFGYVFVPDPPADRRP